MRIGPTGLTGFGTTAPADGDGFGNCIDIQSATGGAVYMRHSGDTTNDTFIVGRDGGNSYLISKSGNIIFNNNGSERMRITDSGQIFMNCTSQLGGGYVQHLKMNSGTGGIIIQNYGSSNTAMVFRNSANNATVGYIATSDVSTSFITSSDYRLTENVVDITDGITRVKQLQPKRFNFISDAGTTVDGFLAHDAQTVVPEAVTGTKDEVDDDGNAVMQGIDQSKLVPLLTAALQEAIAKIETLEARVAALEAG